LPTKTIGRCAFLVTKALKRWADVTGRKLKYSQMITGNISEIPGKS
jgi:hypothetical protein